MKKLLLSIAIFCLSIQVFGYNINGVCGDIIKFLDDNHIPQIEEVCIEGKIYYINIPKLLLLTAGIESNFGQDNYKGRVAKTYMQLEKETVDHYKKVAPSNLKRLFKNENTILNDKNAIINAYVVYMSKLYYHKKLLNKYTYILKESNNDIEFYIYKLFYNSIKGASTYKKWKYREVYFLNYK